MVKSSPFKRVPSYFLQRALIEISRVGPVAIQVSSTCIKHFRRSCGDKNSTTVWCGPKSVCHSRGCNSAIMT